MVEDVSDYTYCNANFIKSPFQEENPRDDRDVPFGLIIASQGPQDDNYDSVQRFWNMCVQFNIMRIVSVVAGNAIGRGNRNDCC